MKELSRMHVAAENSASARLTEILVATNFRAIKTVTFDARQRCILEHTTGNPKQGYLRFRKP